MDFVMIFLLIMLINHNGNGGGLKGVQGSQMPRIIEHPIDSSVPRNDPATLNCKAEGSPLPTIEWYKDGVPLKILPGSHRIMLPSGGLFFLRVMHTRRDTDAGTYWCEAKNEFGISRSRNATLQVAVLRDEFRVEPQHTNVAQSDSVLLECLPPRGSPEPIVTWTKNDQIIDTDHSKRLRIVDSGNLAIQDVRQIDEGEYQCAAENSAGRRLSIKAMLKVLVKPYMINGPQNQTALESTSVIFQCRVGGEPMPDVLWRRSASGGNMPLDRVHILEDRSLRLDEVSIEDAGDYICEADNSVGSVSGIGTLIVHSPPTFLIRPSAQTVEAQMDVSFECQSNGFPKPTMFWSIEGNRSLIFPNSNLENISAKITSNGLSVLTINKLKKSDNGKVIVCSAVNIVGSISIRSRLTVTSIEDSPPPIILQGPMNQTLPIKSVALLHCKATGTPTPMILWYRNGEPVITSNRINVTKEGSLSIGSLDQNIDQGFYTCVASSRCGKSTWTGYLRLDLPTNPNIKFYRHPQTNQLPNSPKKPMVTNITADAITISWSQQQQQQQQQQQHQHQQKQQQQPFPPGFMGYTIEIFSNNISKSWVKVVGQLLDTSYTQSGLTSGATYRFLVRAENSYGLSDPSQISDPIIAGEWKQFQEDIVLTESQAVLSSGEVVVLIQANATDSTSVRLVWEIINGKYVEGFYIYSRKLIDPIGISGNGGSYKMLTVLNGGGAAACTVSGLDKFTDYEFFLIPFYKSIEGRPSNAQRARTNEDVPDGSPTNIEAVMLNSTSVYLKWTAPNGNLANGIINTYHVIVRGLDSYNMSKVLMNMTVKASSPTLLLTHLMPNVVYSVSIAAATRLGLGPFSPPAILKLDPRNWKSDNGYTSRYPISHNLSDDILTQTWFIVLLGSIIAVIIFLFGALVLFKRIQFIKQTTVGGLHENHGIGTIRKFPTLPLNTNGVWIDSSGGIWRQTSTTVTNKDQLNDFAEMTIALQQGLPHPDYERLTPMNVPDYAEVTGCSTFKNPLTSPLYDRCGAYATTNLVKTDVNFQNQYKLKGSINSAPQSFHYTTNSIRSGGGDGGGANSSYSGDLHPIGGFSYSEFNYPMHINKQQQIQQQQLLQQQQLHQQQQQQQAKRAASLAKMNIIENKMDLINNLNRSSSSLANIPNGQSTITSSTASINNPYQQHQQQQQQQQHQQQHQQQQIPQHNYMATMKRSNNRLPKIEYSEKINFGGSGRSLEQPLYVKSKEDGSWKAVPNSTYQSGNNENSYSYNNKIQDTKNNRRVGGVTGGGITSTEDDGSIGGGGGIGGGSSSNGIYEGSASSQIYLTSFGKSVNV